MAEILENIKKLGGGRTAVLLGIAAFAVSAIVVFLLWNQAPDYQTLYAQLSPEDSGAVIERLKEKRVPYKVDGTAISVPLDKVYETRMELAGEGLPQGGSIGFEIFDKTSFGVTEFVQKVNYKRALQGELARTITQIKEIESARVHLAIPEKSIFLDEQKKSRASIIVKLRPGKSLNPDQVSSIVHLVSNSFDNLKPEDVTVVDTFGRMWTKKTEDSSMGLNSSQIEYKKSMEKDLETRLQTMLEKAVGTNKVVARVSLDLDTKHVERTEETYDPESQVIRSEQKSREASTGGTPAIGVPGVASNLPEGAAPIANAASPAQSNKQDEVINYEISKVVSHVIEPVGSVKRMTVAVLVDGIYSVTKGADGKEASNYTARTEEEINKYTEMVKGAIGFSEERGDVISVVNTPFESEFTEAELEVEKAPIIPEYMLPSVIKYASVVIIAVFAIIFILRPIVKRLTEEKAALQAIQKTLPEGHPDLALPEGLAEEDSVERMRNYVKQNPQQVAMVLKSWIKER